MKILYNTLYNKYPNMKEDNIGKDIFTIIVVYFLSVYVVGWMLISKDKIPDEAKVNELVLSRVKSKIIYVKTGKQAQVILQTTIKNQLVQFKTVPQNHINYYLKQGDSLIIPNLKLNWINKNGTITYYPHNVDLSYYIIK